jgi:ketosteroid isomerase-like protein
MDAADFDGVGDLFADGALFDPEGRKIARGRDAVAEFYRRTVMLHDGSPRTEHVTIDPVIEIDEDAGTASALSSYVVHQEIEGSRVSIAAGRYEDGFRRADGLWRFISRRFFVDELGDVSGHLRMPQNRD